MYAKSLRKKTYSFSVSPPPPSESVRPPITDTHTATTTVVLVAVKYDDATGLRRRRRGKRPATGHQGHARTHMRTPSYSDDLTRSSASDRRCPRLPPTPPTDTWPRIALPPHTHTHTHAGSTTTYPPLVFDTVCAVYVIVGRVRQTYIYFPDDENNGLTDDPVLPLGSRRTVWWSDAGKSGSSGFETKSVRPNRPRSNGQNGSFEYGNIAARTVSIFPRQLYFSQSRKRLHSTVRFRHGVCRPYFSSPKHGKGRPCRHWLGTGVSNPQPVVKLFKPTAELTNVK